MNKSNRLILGHVAYDVIEHEDADQFIAVGDATWTTLRRVCETEVA